MDTKKREERARRVAQMHAVLESLYPDARIELEYSNDFECLVAVILSAQCTDARVNVVTRDLFKKYRTLDEYAHAQQTEMEKDVFSCGFYRNKAKNIISAAIVVRDEFHGELPRSIEAMMRIPGVARKTANVVLSTLYGIHEGIAVDTHVRRFALRFDLTDFTDPIRIEKDLMEIVDRSQWWSFNHRLVHYGRHLCKALPHDCREHPLTAIYPKANMLWPKSR